jgi:signal transduction histidine kinase
MLSKFLFILIFFITYTASAGQEPRNPDSLLLKIKNSGGMEKAKAYNLAAGYYARANPDTAIYFSRQAINISEKLHDTLTAGEAFAAIATCNIYKSQYDSAVSYCFKAIKIAEKMNDLNTAARAYNNLGVVFRELQDFPKAIFYKKKASYLKLQQGDTLRYAMINCNIANDMQSIGKSKEAIAILRDCEVKLKSLNNVDILAAVYNNLGSVYSGLQNHDSAMYYFKKNISLPSTPGNQSFVAFANLAEIYSEKGDFKNAEINLFKALKLSEKLERNADVIYVYSNISRMYERKKDFKNALLFKKLQTGLKDSLFTQDKERIIRELESKYQADKKDLTIKQQELLLEQERNKRNTFVFISVLIVLILLITAAYFWLKKRNTHSLEKAKSKLFQNIVHEIRTPLTLILAPLQMIKKDAVGEQNKENLELINRNSEKLMVLVDELLTALRLEKEEYKINPFVGDIILHTKNLLQNLAHEAVKNEVKLVFSPVQTNSILAFESQAFEKILNNLVLNAIKYNKAGGYVEVILDANQNGIILTVNDNGIGINATDKKRLFERFYRADGHKSTPGFGIGLSIVNDLVKLLDGKISLQSEPGRGTTFTVTLPPVHS